MVCDLLEHHANGGKFDLSNQKSRTYKLSKEENIRSQMLKFIPLNFIKLIHI